MAQLKTSDYLATATDEIGNAMATTRAQWLRSSGQKREELKKTYNKLKKRLQKLMFRDIKQIDKDTGIKKAIADLQDLSELILKTRREMTTAAKTVEKAKKIIGYADKILGIIGDVGLV